MTISDIPENIFDSLTFKEKVWLKYYFETRNKAEAAIKAFNIKDRKAAASIGHTISKRKKIRMILTQLFVEDETLSQLKLKEALVEEIFYKEAKTAPERQVRVKAMELFMKLTGMLPTGGKIKKENVEDWKSYLDIKMEDGSESNNTP
uniref:Terminase small subunit n=1 Tax=candidate division CPR3 bacterium TaxID=2268181 RepID=A0A7V3J9Z6_UNCC3